MTYAVETRARFRWLHPRTSGLFPLICKSSSDQTTSTPSIIDRTAGWPIPIAAPTTDIRQANSCLAVLGHSDNQRHLVAFDSTGSQ